MHIYQDTAAPVADTVGELVREWRYGRAKVAVTPDPAWANVAHLRT